MATGTDAGPGGRDVAGGSDRVGPTLAAVAPGLYCLRSASGEWEPHVICLLPDARSADVDFTSGSGVVVAAGSWYAEDHEIVVEDTVRRAREPARQRYRRFSTTRVNGRGAFIGYADGRDGTGQSAGHPLTYVLASTDTSIEVEVSGGQYEQRPVEELIYEFERETQRQLRMAGEPLPPSRPTAPSRHQAPQGQFASSTQRLPSSKCSLVSDTVDPLIDRPSRRATLEDSPYITNPFRVLGLPATADQREVSRRAKELAMRAQLEDDDNLARQLREAETALADPVRRFTDELLWLWSGPRGPAADIDLRDDAAVTGALKQLAVTASAGTDEATHDLAVLAHAVVLEDEAAATAVWQTALSSWGTLFGSERFWHAATMRAELIGDPRLTSQTVHTLRAELPRRLLDPTARAIARLLGRQRDDDAAARLQLLIASGLPFADVARARTTATASLRAELTAAETELSDARTAFDDDTDAAILRTAANRVADRAVSVLARLARLDPQSPETRVRADDLAEGLRLVSVRLHNDADDTTGAAGLAQRAAGIAVSDSVRSRLTTDTRMLWRLAAQQRANDLAGREDWDGAARELGVALGFADDAEMRGGIERSLNVCRTNAAMKRAVAAAQAQNWAAAISAAQEARSTSASPDERANIESFIARCRQAATMPPTTSSTSSVPSGKLVLAWVFALALVLLANSASFPISSAFAVDGSTVRIRGARGQIVSGSIPTGSSLGGRIAYPSGLQFQVQNGAGGGEQQTAVAPVQPSWPQTIETRGTGGNSPVTATVSLRIPNAPGTGASKLQGQIVGPTRYPSVTGPNRYEERNSNVSLNVEIEVLGGVRAALSGLEPAVLGFMNFVKSWAGFIGLVLFFSFWGIIPPWIGSKLRGASRRNT